MQSEQSIAESGDTILHTETQKTCLIYSSGGHYAEIKRALNGIVFTCAYHVTFAISDNSRQIDNVAKRYFITHPQRKILRTLKNAWESFWLLWNERPRFIISTGADVAVPTLVLGKLLFGCKVIFVESAGDIAPTLTGRLIYPFADLFIVQWPEKLKYFPNAVLSQGVLL